MGVVYNREMKNESNWSYKVLASITDVSHQRIGAAASVLSCGPYI